VSTAWGAFDSGGDRFQIPRILPWDQSGFRFGFRLLRSYDKRITGADQVP
jgi:hypothetical protein